MGVGVERRMNRSIEILYVQSSLDLVNLNLVKNLDLVKISVLTDFLLHKIIRFSKFLKICRKSLDLVKKRGL